MAATDIFSLFTMAKERSKSVAAILLGMDIPLTNSELASYNTYQIATARLEQQQSKGI